jgi:hypothetical protein
VPPVKPVMLSPPAPPLSLVVRFPTRFLPLTFNPSFRFPSIHNLSRNNNKKRRCVPVFLVFVAAVRVLCPSTTVRHFVLCSSLLLSLFEIERLVFLRFSFFFLLVISNVLPHETSFFSILTLPVFVRVCYHCESLLVLPFLALLTIHWFDLCEHHSWRIETLLPLPS